MQITRPAPKVKIPKSAKNVFKGLIFDVYQWEQKLFDGSLATFERLKRVDTVNVIPVTRDRKIILLHQRQPGTALFTGFAGGRIDGNEGVAEAAERELLEETGPVVTKTRQYAEELSQKVRADYLLLDTAAGMHCSVIRGLIGVDLVMAVTEPTPLGAHDLRLILQLTNKLGLPTQIVLNQADLGKSKAIEKIAKRAAVEIKNKILYSKKIVNAYSRGRLQEINIL